MGGIGGQSNWGGQRMSKFLTVSAVAAQELSADSDAALPFPSCRRPKLPIPALDGSVLASGIPDGILEHESMRSSLAKTLKLVLLGCVIALGAARTANAGYVVINADPVYGAQFPGLSWRAIGALYVPDGCLTSQMASAQTNPVTVTLGSIDPVCRESKIDYVQLQFYQTGTNVEIETLNIGDYIADANPADPNRNRLDGELINFTLFDDIDDGIKLTGFQTTLSKAVRATTVGGGNYCFSLELSSASARVESLDYSNGACATTINQRPEEDNDNLLTKARMDWIPTFVDGSTATAPQFTGLVAADLPEPASWALTLAALAAAFGAGSLARRSRG